MTARAALLILSPTILYLLALNPYLLPDISDNLGYYYGALSIAEKGTYEFDGHTIDAWPPVLPLFLAIPFLLGFKSVWSAKLVIIAFAALGMIFTYLYLSRARYQHALAATVFAWILPELVQSGSRIMSETPFLTLSLVFLLLLHQQRDQRRGIPFAVIAGGALGCASLTRWIGVLLGVAVIAQAISQLRTRRDEPFLKRCLPEAVTSVVGAAMLLGWCFLHIGSMERMQFFGDWERHDNQIAVTEERRQDPGESIWLKWKPWEIEEDRSASDKAARSRFFGTTDRVGDLFLKQSVLFRMAGIPRDHPLRFLFMIASFVILAGIASRIRSKKIGPSDWYVFATILSIGLVSWSPARFWIPLAPFLTAYLFEGCSLSWNLLTGWLKGPLKKFAPAAVIAGYALFQLVFTADRLFLPNYPNGGLSYFASPSPEDFYLRYWGDLYSTCTAIRDDGGEGKVVFAGHTEPEIGFAGIYDYVEHFSGCRPVNYPPADPPAYLLVKMPLEVPEILIEELDLSLLKESPSFKSYRIGKTP